jgi:hypothetical protein
MVFVPREPFSAAALGLAGGPPRAVPSDAVLAAASRLMPADIAQKVVLLAIFALACSGAAALLRREHWLARLAAGVFYAWNPFVAERLIIGQWALLLGYAGLPWVLRSVTGHSVASWRGAWRLLVALLPAAVGGFAAMAVSALVAVPAALLARPPADQAEADRTWAGRAGATGIALLVLVGCSLPWLVPALLHPVYASPAGVTAFAARADTPFGSFGSLLMLGGLWNAQTVPAAYGGAWSVLWLGVVVTACGGYAVLAARRRRWPGLGVAAVAGLAIASVGLTAPGRHLLQSAIGLWPGFAVLRDGQQFAGPLALAEAAGFGLVVAWAMRPGLVAVPGTGHRIHDHDRFTADSAGESVLIMNQRSQCARRGGAGPAIGVLALLAPVLLLPGLAWGAAGRLHPVSYPADWLAAARVINQSAAPGDALLLPWAAYRRPAWNHGEAILDPWPRLLARPVIWNDGGSVGTTRLAPDDPGARRLDAVVRSGAPLTAALQAAGVRFVIADAGGQVRLRLPGCTVVISRPDLVIYQVPAARRR